MPPRGVDAHKLYPEEYYRKIWFDKTMFDVIEFVSKVERLHKLGVRSGDSPFLFRYLIFFRW
jgi:hypothetical protein